ncbi:zinc finger protein 184 isoform X2 [Parambassis ranga]|uniref:Zinc finger protein 184 isoform X2 n=1 Tax=Parambassis ranga TaxID=210632 RepID=A0A6P7K4L2_9TELE|nr:zinc finger protein 184-like isoform X2 [Parambassis ranga]
MSAGIGSLQEQVESVLGALLKAATVELTQLFESRYRALEADVRRIKEEPAKESTETLDSLTKRSIGVQVEEDDIYVPCEISGPPILLNGDCLGEHKEMVVVEGCLIPSEILKADPEWSPPKDLGDPYVAQSVYMDLSDDEGESVTDGGTNTDVVMHVSAETCTGTLDCESMTRFPEQKPIVIQPDTSDATSEEKVKFVCPLILKTAAPDLKTETSKEPVKDEPQQACVSTAKGTAYSPSPLDGTTTPEQVAVWERVHTLKEEKNHLLMKVNLCPPDQKLLRPCAVQLVNVLTMGRSKIKVEGKASKAHSHHQNTGWPLPKDLRRHRGLHTGHRLCCFNNCGNGIWRLQQVVAHSRGGYSCNTCGKTFKKRKILRRHERFHTGEKPYKCPVCSKMFALRKSLRRHTRFHTGERPHTCLQCGKSFRVRDNLKTHLRFHTGEKPYNCDTCGKMFRILRNLKKHRLTECEHSPSFRNIAGLTV